MNVRTVLLHGAVFSVLLRGAGGAAPIDKALTTGGGRPDEVLVVNRGIGGNSSADGLRRFRRDVTDLSPDHLILYFGINDALNSKKLVNPRDFRANLQQMIDRAREAKIKTIVLVTPNPILGSYVKARHPTRPETDLQEHLKRYDHLVRECARENGLPLADLRALVERRGGAHEGADCLIRNEANGGGRDGVHLTAEGYRLMAGLFEPLFRSVIRPGEVVVCLGDSLTYGANMKGAGTIRGDTFPAWLSVILNRLAGVRDRRRPPDPPPSDPARTRTPG